MSNRDKDITTEQIAAVQDEIICNQIIFGSSQRRRLFITVTCGGTVTYTVKSADADPFECKTFDEAVKRYNDL